MRKFALPIALAIAMLIGGGIFGPQVARAVTCSVPYVFSPNTTIFSSQVNANFSALTTCFSSVFTSVSAGSNIVLSGPSTAPIIAVTAAPQFSAIGVSTSAPAVGSQTAILGVGTPIPASTGQAQIGYSLGVGTPAPSCTGCVAATTFSGSGAGLTNIPASALPSPAVQGLPPIYNAAGTLQTASTLHTVVQNFDVAETNACAALTLCTDDITLGFSGKAVFSGTFSCFGSVVDTAAPSSHQGFVFLNANSTTVLNIFNASAVNWSGAGHNYYGEYTCTGSS